MSPENRDAAFLWDMLTAACDVNEFLLGVNFHQFSSNKILRYAVERQLVVIGEAAKKVSDSFKQQHPEIPWSGIIAQRNIIAHEYGEILLERIWYAVSEKIPELTVQLETIIPPLPKDP